MLNYWGRAGDWQGRGWLLGTGGLVSLPALTQEIIMSKVLDELLALLALEKI